MAVGGVSEERTADPTGAGERQCIYLLFSSIINIISFTFIYKNYGILKIIKVLKQNTLDTINKLKKR